MNTSVDKSVAILILAYNGIDRLKLCLENLKWVIDRPNTKIVLVDNGSIDPIAPLVKSKYPWISFIKNSENLGFAIGQNSAYEFIKNSGKTYKYILALNPDTLLNEDVLDKMIEQIEKDENIGLIGPKIINDDGQLEKSIHIKPTAFTFFYKLIGLDLQYLINYRKYKAKRAVRVFSVSGACMLIKTQVIEKVGYFDTDFFFYYEDVDLCKRINDAGYFVYYLPSVVIKHARGRSVSTQSDKNWSKEQTYISSWIYFKKNSSLFEKCLLKYGRMFEMNLRILINFEREWAKKMLLYFKDEKISN